MDEKEKHLVDLDLYLKAGSHIGTKFKTGDMQRYIFKQKRDGLKVLDVKTIDEKVGTAAAFLSQFEGSGIVVVARKAYGQQPAKVFAELVGGKGVFGRFVPGTFTNPTSKGFIEPKVLLVTDPDSDRQAVLEAVKLRIPIVGLCSTNNYLRNIDLAVPVNNKGRKSLALVYFLLAREILKGRGTIKKDSDFDKKLEDFEYKLKEGGEEEEHEQRDRRRFTRGRRR